MNSAISIESRIPSHVPPELTTNFDMYHVGQGYPDFHAEAAALSAHSQGALYTSKNGGHWVVVGYDLISKMARASDIFSSMPYTIPTFENQPLLAPLFYDPPAHTPYRNIFNRTFTPGMAAKLVEKIRGRAVELIERVKDQKQCEFVETVSEPLPVSVFLEMFGIPASRLHDYREHVKMALGSTDLAGKQAGFGWLAKEMLEMVQQRQEKREDDILSAMLDMDIEGRKPTTEEMVEFGLMMFSAGLDTTTVSMTYGIRYLATHPNFQTFLRETPARITDAKEELLRLYSAAQPGRTVTQDTELDGILFKKGDRVLLLVAAGSLDPKIFDRPAEADIDRPKQAHLAFHAGPHRCSGMHLARVELQILYEEWLKRIPQFRVDERHSSTFTGGHVLAINNLNLRWD